MRIAINALLLRPANVGGVEFYIRGLVDGLMRVDRDNSYALIVGPEAASTFRLSSSRWRLIVGPFPSAHRWARLALEQAWLPVVARWIGAHLIHSIAYTAPLVTGLRSVVTIHDMNYRYHPEDFTPLERLAYATLVPRVARRSGHIITVSEAARAEVARLTGTPLSKVTAVPHGPRRHWPGDPRDDRARLTAAGVRRPFVLSVAASYPHKNLRRLIEAFPLDPGDERATTLVLVGMRGRGHEAVAAAARQRPGVVTILGWVPDALLGSLYRNAVALALPSLYEGFGLPIIEAMALGTPVLTSNYGAMAEVAGGAAELVDPTDSDAIRRELRRIADDVGHRERLRRLGLARAGDFSWDKTATQTRAVYESFAASGPRPSRGEASASRARRDVDGSPPSA